MELSIAAPYMIAQALPRTTVHYDIVEGQWKCTDACEASYYCVHNWYHASGQFTGIVDGSGYAGFQFKDGTTWTNFSIWETAHGMPSLEYAPPGSHARPFSGEGTGFQILAPYPWQKGKWYTMRIQARTVGSKTVYEQWIRPEGGTWYMHAAISFPKPGLGFTWDCFFLEDWIGNDLLRSCQLRGYYARKNRFSWASLDRFLVYNTRGSQQNVIADCGFGAVGRDAIWISSGGGHSMTLPSLPHELRIKQARRPETNGVLG